MVIFHSYVNVYQRVISGNLLQVANWKPWPIESSSRFTYERWWFSSSQTVSLPEGICTWILWEGQSPIALRRRGLDEWDRLGHWFWDSSGTGAENARDWRWNNRGALPNHSPWLNNGYFEPVLIKPLPLISPFHWYHWYPWKILENGKYWQMKNTKEPKINVICACNVVTMG